MIVRPFWEYQPKSDKIKLLAKSFREFKTIFLKNERNLDSVLKSENVPKLS
jgi:hypothetical protein